MNQYYPMRLQPIFQSYLWGGERLKTNFRKQAEGPLAESWELCGHKAGSSVVLNGIRQGQTLPRLMEQDRRALLGEACMGCSDFPVMLKLIDAKQSLSVQVHPDNTYALRTEGEPGKTEMWYILEAEPEAFLYFGLEEDCTKEAFQKALENGSVTSLLHRVAVKPGDCFFIPAGTVHAIGAGILLAEIQQNSNTTYRVYDFDRTDAQGHKRELHLQKALDVACLNKESSQGVSGEILWDDDASQKTALPACPYFSSSILTVRTALAQTTTPRSFVHLLVLEGDGALLFQDERFSLQKGDSLLLPAALGSFRLLGPCRLFCTEMGE